MNNKGQTLVLFVILLPLLFIVISLIVDTGLLYLYKEKITNIIKDNMKYTIENNKDNTELVKLIYANDDRINIDKINTENEITYLNISYEYKSLILNKKSIIKLSFKAYLENNKVIIKKE